MSYNRIARQAQHRSRSHVLCVSAQSFNCCSKHTCVFSADASRCERCCFKVHVFKLIKAFCYIVAFRKEIKIVLLLRFTQQKMNTIKIKFNKNTCWCSLPHDKPWCDFWLWRESLPFIMWKCCLFDGQVKVQGV